MIAEFERQYLIDTLENKEGDVSEAVDRFRCHEEHAAAS